MNLIAPARRGSAREGAEAPRRGFGRGVPVNFYRQDGKVETPQLYTGNIVARFEKTVLSCLRPLT